MEIFYCTTATLGQLHVVVVIVVFVLFHYFSFGIGYSSVWLFAKLARRGARAEDEPVVRAIGLGNVGQEAEEDQGK